MCRHKLPGPDLMPAERATSKSSEQKTWERKQLQKGTLYSETLPLLWTLWPKPCDDICHAFIILNVWGNLCSTGVSGPSVFPVQISETACAAWAVVISDSFTAAWLITAMYVQHYLIKRWAGAETRLNPADVSVWNKMLMLFDDSIKQQNHMTCQKHYNQGRLKCSETVAILYFWMDWILGGIWFLNGKI